MKAAVASTNRAVQAETKVGNIVRRFLEAYAQTLFRSGDVW